MTSEAAFAAAVLAAYANLPETPLGPSHTDQAVARRLFRDSVSLPIIESALLLGSLRRLHRSQDLPPLPKIRSLAYFLPVIEELRLRSPMATSSTFASSSTGSRPHPQKDTFSEDR